VSAKSLAAEHFMQFSHSSVLVRFRFDHWRNVTTTAPYSNDTLRWIAAEIRFPPQDSLAASIPEALRAHLRDAFPIREEQSQLALSIGPGGPMPQQNLVHRFVRRDRLASVTLGRDVVSLETTNYPGWAEFRKIIDGIVSALEEHAKPDGTNRIGLRYVDEVRVPNAPATIAEWSEWIDDRLVVPFTLENDPPLSNGTVLLQYGVPPGFLLVLRAGPVPEGRTVQVEGPLRMPFKTPAGPYFLLDSDASWADPLGQFPEFQSTQITGVLDALHDTCQRAFESAITDRLRIEILRRPREEVWPD
jgi:uncharacterized protein (TIGR04255 family)